MEKIRNLAAVAFCCGLLIFGIQLCAGAQERPKNAGQTGESPGDLGRNTGPGDPVLRTGSWELDRITTTAIHPDVSSSRDTKDLPVNTRERSGISWSQGGYLIKAAVVFMDLKEIVTGTNRSGADPRLQVLVKTEVLTTKDVGGKNDYLLMQCSIDFTLASGDRLGGPLPRYFRIDHARYPDYKKDEFTCGGDLKPPYLGGKDFTLNLELKFITTKPVDVTYHFHYRFRDWKVANPSTSGNANSSEDAGVAPSDREGQYWWAQKQDASALESTLNAAAARLFNSPSASAEKLSSAFADVSVIIAERAAKANFPPGDKDAASVNWSTHKNWATRQGPKTALENLQQKLAAAFQHLSRSQKDLFFADVRVAIAKAEVGPTSETAAAPQNQNRSLVQPTKSVFGVNEDITIDYYNAKGSGWDSVVIVNPNRTAEGKGPFSSIDDRYAKKFDPNDNSLKERNGTFTFRGLPEGEYEVRYVAWYLDGMAGANKALGPVRFRVGNQVSVSPPSGAGPGTNSPTAVNPAKDLTGLWRNPGGNAFYRVRQIGTKLVWGIDAVAMGSWANVFHGEIAGNTIDGVWEDLPGSPTIGGGRMLLRIESECRFVRVSSVNPYGADVWVKKDSTCDVDGQAQRSNPSGTKPAKATNPAATDRQTEPVVAINDRDRVFEKPANARPTPVAPAKNKPTATAPTNKPNKPPVVEELPADNRPTTTSNKPAPRRDGKPPVVEEIPEDNTPTVAANKPAPKRDKPPVVEEIPEEGTSTVAANRPAPGSGRPPVVEEIPETPATNNPGSNRSSGNSSRSNRTEKEKLPPGVKRDKNGKLQPKDGWEWVNPNDPNDTRVQKKPRDPNKPDLWTQLGGALREAITQQPPQQPGTTAGQPQQQDGTCRGGAYWLGTPTPDSWKLGTPGAGVRVPWSTPLGIRKASLRIFRGGQDVTGPLALPENTNDCGLSWSLYMNSAGYYDVYLYDPNGAVVAGPVRFTVYQ